MVIYFCYCSVALRSSDKVIRELSLSSSLPLVLQHGECMRVVYRMRGLLGDATEDIVERLDSGKDRDVDEEEDYKMAAVLSRCNGLDVILTRLAHIKDFVQGHQLISAALKLLGFCIKLKVGIVGVCLGV